MEWTTVLLLTFLVGLLAVLLPLITLIIGTWIGVQLQSWGKRYKQEVKEGRR